MRFTATHDTAPGVQSALAGLEAISTPEIRSIQARRLVLERIGRQIRELLDQLHAVRCAELRASGDAAQALRRQEVELEARVIVLQGQR